MNFICADMWMLGSLAFACVCIGVAVGWLAFAPLKGD